MNSDPTKIIDENVNEVVIKTENFETLIGPAVKITGEFKLGGQKYRGEVETNPLKCPMVEAHIEAFLKTLEPVKSK